LAAECDTGQAATDKNSEQHIRKLQEGFAATKSFAQLQTNIFESLKVDIDKSAQKTEEFLARVGALQQSDISNFLMNTCLLLTKVSHQASKVCPRVPSSVRYSCSIDTLEARHSRQMISRMELKAL
jgi:hypothetical protein